MNRCTPHTLATLATLAILTCMAASALLSGCATDSTGATSAVRTFPAAALRGEMVVSPTPPAITLDGKLERLSPGSRIRGIDNMLVMSASLVNKTAVVNYLREPSGNVHEVWILSPDEIKLKRPNSKASWFNFGSSTTAETPAAALPR